MRIRRTTFAPLICLSSAISLTGCPADDGNGSGDTEQDSEGIGTIGMTASMTANETETDANDQGTVDSTDEGPDDTCGTADFMIEAVPTRVLLVLDKSGSMVNNTWDHDDDPSTEEITRWASLHATVELITTNFSGGLELGVLLYPSLSAVNMYNDSACIVGTEPEVAVAPDNGQAVIDAIPGPDDDAMIQGGTPSATAIEVALEHLRSLGEEFPRAILFVTDGEANCRSDATNNFDLFESYDENLHTVVENGFQIDGIPTYVVGIAIRTEETLCCYDDGTPPPNPALDGVPDGVNPDMRLDELAEQGGRPRDGSPRYYATENQLELEVALNEIATQEISCFIPLDPPPTHPNFVEIQIGNQTVEPVTDCATEDGWVYTNPDGPYEEIQLCGAACELLAAEGTLEAFYGCPPPE